MTQRSYPWTGTLTGDAGPYSADDWSKLQDAMVGIGANTSGAGNSGIIWGSGSISDPGLSVTANSPAGQSVILTLGIAFVNGTLYINDSNLVLSVAANGSGNTRIDTVVLQKLWATQQIRAVVKQGTPAGSPVPPSMVQSAGTVWEIPIADLTLANGYTTITAANIVQRLNYKNTIVMDVIDNMVNASGALCNPGDAVVWGTVANQFTSSLLRGAPIAGIVMDRIAAGAAGRLLRRGLYYVRLGGASPAIGSTVVHDSNFVSVIPSSLSSLWNSFAITRAVTGGAGLCLCYVDVTQPKLKALISNVYAVPSDIVSASTSYVDIDTANMLVTIITNTGYVHVKFTFVVYFGHTVGSAWLHFNIMMDGATPATADTRGIYMYQSGQSTGDAGDTGREITVEFVFKGITPGQHTFRPQWKSILGTAGSPVMGVRAYNAAGGAVARLEAFELEATP